MDSKIVINVPEIAPQQKHASIFKAFDSLENEQTLVLCNDHDPKPVYYELVHQKGNCFSWQYIQEGPDVWVVEITKKQSAPKEDTIGEMARKDFRKAEVFKKMGIDFCCGGKKTVAQACEAKGLNLQLVLQELAKAEQSGSASSAQHNFDAWPLSFLADYIINVHHAYVKNSVELLDELSARVSHKHGDHFPELIAIRENTVALLEELTAHLQKEEMILFPYVKQLEQKGNNAEATCASFGTVQNPIWVMEQEHENAGDILKKLRVLTNGYTVPPNACNSFNFLYKKLEEFEADLHQHIHLENNILFPKAIILEKEMAETC